MKTVSLSREEARAFLLAQLGLERPVARAKSERGRGPHVRALLRHLRCIQLDPLDPMGTNADLVAMARLPGLRRGEIYRHVYAEGAAFEHFAKERCLLPASAFPHYRARMVQTPWWRLTERTKRVPQALVDEVEAEVRERGPISAKALSDRGRVQPLDWSGWKGTSKASSMALEILWTRCRIVVCGRSPEGKLYDVPERALGEACEGATFDGAISTGAISKGAISTGADAFARWGIVERVEAAGLLAQTSGPTWSMLSDARTSPLPDTLVEEGALEAVRLEGSTRRFFAPAGFVERKLRGCDDAMRILGPLDPVLWDRKLVRELFDFDYVWEVYKPEAQRRFAWYVMPLLHRGALVGRISGRVEGTTLVIDGLWREENAIDDVALDAALNAHAEACGCDAVKRPKRARRA
ncbi:MAG: YcaQ family DNA glycosylase [Sandaracinus sp.]|nr:YcaQ family DNA glycosylase [Sandaracinus sp.]MCB9619121.1 YcaQ family DNA glycosylase [Sandaracinus sp.]MCB9632704.1 YcaQ family DNA glycosylase [Sandaracinus sp.]